jgi:putative glutamine amidotransferase
LREIIKRKKRVLGICRGMQLMNIEFGWDLVQDIPNAKQHNQYEKQYEYVDTIEIDSESFLEEAFQRRELPINSIHHQAVNTLGRGFRIVARSKHDGTPEAIEHESLPLYGVQWHPESLLEQRDLFRWFISKSV